MWKNRAAWLVIVLAALGFYLFENNGGTRALLFTLVLLPAVSASLLYLPRLRVSVELDLPETARRNEPVGGTLRLKNEGKAFFVRFSADLTIRNLLTGEESVLAITSVVRAGKTAEVPFSVSAAHSGKLAVSLRGAAATDLLGLFRRRLPAAAERTAIVPPIVSPVALTLADTADFLTDNQSYSTRKPGYDPSETFRIREYAPGDPIRQIHWKLSQKTGTTLVRDFGLPVVRRMLLLLETTALSGAAAEAGDGKIFPEDMDTLLDLLFSVSTELLAMEIPHTVGWHDQRLDSFASREIIAAEDLETLRGALLENPVTGGETTVAGSYGRSHAECAYAHVVLFSPYAPPDAGVLLHGNRVTALLPEQGAASSAALESGLETVVFRRETLRGGTMQLVL